MSCASGPQGRALETLADPARAKGAIRRIAASWASTPRLYAPGSRRPRSTRAPGREPPPTRHSGSRSWRKSSES